MSSCASSIDILEISLQIVAGEILFSALSDAIEAHVVNRTVDTRCVAILTYWLRTRDLHEVPQLWAIRSHRANITNED